MGGTESEKDGADSGGGSVCVYINFISSFITYMLHVCVPSKACLP